MPRKDTGSPDPAAESWDDRLQRVNHALLASFTTPEQRQLFSAYREAEAEVRDQIEDRALDRYSEALAGHFPAFAPAIHAVWRQVLEADPIRAAERA